MRILLTAAIIKCRIHKNPNIFGLSIQYRGRIGKPECKQQLTHDLIRLAHKNGWEYKDLTSQKDTNTVELILELHPECEPVFLLFDSSGRLRAPGVDETELQDSHWCSVKTQYAPIETHIALIDLLRYIAQNYMPDLEVVDEGGYWKTGDVEALQAARDCLTEKLDSVVDALAGIQRLPDEQDPESITDLVEEAIKNRLESDKRKLN
jgi:hypothetical protein